MSSQLELPAQRHARSELALRGVEEAAFVPARRQTSQAALDAVRKLRAAGSDALIERFSVVDAHDRPLTLLCLRAEHARSAAVCSAWLDRAACNHALSAEGVAPLLAYGLHAGRPAALLPRSDDALPLSLLLAHLVQRQESPPLALALYIVRALCDGLASAHALTLDGAASPLFHGDLCSEQVLVRADGRLQLGALGLWCALPPQHAYRLRAGRAGATHLPPEQAHGRPADARGDVYALGVLLRHLVQGVHDAGTGDTRLTIEPTARMLIMLLGRLLAAAPEARLGSIDALRDALDRLPRHAAGALVLSRLHAEVRDGGQATAPRSRAPGATLRMVAPRLAAHDGDCGEPLSEAATAPHRRTSAPPAHARSAPAPRASVAPPPPVVVPPPAARIASDLREGRYTLPGCAPPPDLTQAAPADLAPALAAAVAQRLVASVDAGRMRRGRWRDASETVFKPKPRALTRFITTRSQASRLALPLVLLTALLTLVAAWLLIRLLL